MSQEIFEREKMIYIKSKNELLSMVHREKEIYIYGAGKIAEEIIKILPADGMYRIAGIIVTDAGQNPSILNGIPVKALSEYIMADYTMVLIAAGKKYHEEIIYNLDKRSFYNVSIISEEFELELVDKLRMPVKIEQYIKRTMPQTRMEALVVNICDHCNLNCRGCDHFSPIAKKRFVALERLIKDLNQMRKILGENIELISIMGGEPLLHPELIKIMLLTRKIFPNTRIWLSTNGLLLLRQSPKFWECCKDSKIELCVTKYPVNFSYESAKEISEKYNVKWNYYNGNVVEKTLGHYPLDIRGLQDARESFLHCFHANGGCNMLSEGKLYTCTVAPNLHIFAQKYGIDISFDEDDGIDIYTVQNKRELFEYLSKPMPICRFCKVQQRTFRHAWEQSKGIIQEWT